MSLPPIQPEKLIDPLFHILEDYYFALQAKFETIIQEHNSSQKKSHDLELLQQQLYSFFSIFQPIHFSITHPSYQFHISPHTPRNIKEKLFPLSKYLTSLDREHYKNFFKKLSKKMEQLQKRTIELDKKIIQEIRAMRQINQSRSIQRSYSF